jgi:hypothetical protein
MTTSRRGSMDWVVAASAAVGRVVAGVVAMAAGWVAAAAAPPRRSAGWTVDGCWATAGPAGAAVWIVATEGGAPGGAAPAAASPAAMFVVGAAATAAGCDVATEAPASTLLSSRFVRSPSNSLARRSASPPASCVVAVDVVGAAALAAGDTVADSAGAGSLDRRSASTATAGSVAGV